jgi:hypothetical protein
MKNTINYIRKAFNLSNSNSNLVNNEKEELSCNYSNNYYGDQYCQAKTKSGS